MAKPQKRWRLLPQQKELSETLGAKLNKHPVIAQLLLNRQINSLKDAHYFISPEHLEKENFPKEDLDKMTQLIGAVVDAKQSILIYGDYDVDGMTSTAMMASVLRKCGAQVKFFIPNRFKEGYGLSSGVIDTLLQDNISLLLTLDCGISNAKEIAEIKEKTGAKVGIFDHHNIPDSLPDAEAMLNPKFLESDSPIFGLCTAGIVYKFLEYFVQERNANVEIESYLDLCALGTIADIASLTGVNRVLTKQGLRRLSTAPCMGIKQLLVGAKFDKPAVSVRDVGFLIAPRLNAAGRLKDARLGVDLLLSESESDARYMADILEKMNIERRSIGEQMLKESELSLTSSDTFKDERVIALEGKGWHAGVIGITAARLVEQFSRPTVLIATDERIGRGSARSVGEVDIYSLLYQCRPYFINFGGHKQAAGFSILPENVKPFQEKLKAICAEQLDSKQLMPIIEIEGVLEIDDLRHDLVKELESLEPFGAENPLPIFYMNTLKAIDFRAVGDGSHLKVTFTNKEENFFIDAIGFGLSHKMELLYKDQVEIAFNLDVNVWRGKETLQLCLVDIK